MLISVASAILPLEKMIDLRGAASCCVENVDDDVGFEIFAGLSLKKPHPVRHVTWPVSSLVRLALDGTSINRMSDTFEFVG